MSKRKENYFFAWISRIVQIFSGNPLRITFLILSDLLWSVAVLLCTLVLYRDLIPGQDHPIVIFRDFWCVAGTIIIINSISKCYHGSILNPGAALNRIEEIRRLSFSVLGAYFLGYLILHINGRGNAYPLPAVLISMICTMLGMPFVRFFTRFFMKKTKTGQIRVFIAGAGKTARMVGEELETSTYYGYRIIGYFDDDMSKKNQLIHGKKLLGRICDAPRLAKKYNVHSVICCLPPILLLKITRTYSQSFKHVLVIPSNSVLPITAVYPTMIGFFSGFEYQNRLLVDFPRFFKRIAEIVISFSCIILLMPLFIVLALLVKLSSPGPVFYTAKRLGFRGKEIKVFKFRTMYQDADSRLEALLEENPQMKTEWKEKFKFVNDPRITKIGHFLRKSSLDELPQFINVLRGEMSIIGPRPIVPDEVKYYKEAYDFFKRVRPGITGLWQVSGRSDTTYDQRVALDMFYVMNWSIWLDWYILWKTVWSVLICNGSY